MFKIKLLFCLLVLGIYMISCNKNSTKTTPYSVRMTDAPGPYDSVIIDLRSVELTGSDGKNITIETKAGLYNLIELSNGTELVIASANLQPITIQQVRLILGTNNYIFVDSVRYPLATPSGEQSGLKLQVHETLQAGIPFTVLIDFDANKSITDDGKGNYKLKPVLRVIEISEKGAIKGKISPAGTSAFVTATTNLNVSYSSNVNSKGEFTIKGLPDGTYSFMVTPSLPFNPYTVNTVVISNGETVNLGTINL